MMTVLQSKRDEFWRAVNAELLADDLEAANNSEIEAVIHRTTSPQFAAEFIIQMRQPCWCCGNPTHLRDGHTPTCLDCFGRAKP